MGTPGQQAVAMEVDNRGYESLEINDLDVREIVLSHLVHNCYKETAQTFIEAAGLGGKADFCAGVDTRKAIYSAVLEGRALEAIALIRGLGGDLLEKHEELHFDLLSLHFIEYVRSNNWKEALTVGKDKLKPFGDKYLEKLQDCMALLAYPEPGQSPLFSLLSLEHRQSIAESVNRAVLEHENLPGHASLERLLQQTVVVRKCLREEAGKDASQPFCLSLFIAS